MSLPPSILRRIQIRCFVRARRRRRYYGYSRSKELHFFAGAIAVLDCLRDDGAKVIRDDWILDIVRKRPIGDPSPEAEAIRKHEREQLAEMLRSLSQ